jgi:Protein of unknown function (DUF551).
MTNEEAAKILKLERDSWRMNPRLKVDQRLYDAFDVAIKALDQTRWIPVSERLPEKNGECLVTVSFHFCGEIVFKCSFATDLHKVDEYEFPEHKCGFYGIDSEWGSYEINDVIAWMPLPEPYKEESEE